MTIRKIIGITGIAALGVTLGCLDPYMPPETERTSYEFLVVDALLNTTSGSAEVTLRRTLPLEHKDSVTHEQYAAISVLDDNGATYALTEVEPGRYSAASIPVDMNRKYKVSIRTINGLMYESALVAPMTTPEIDSVTWETEGKETFSVLVNTHNDAAQPGYYRWRFIETWTYNSAFNSIVKYENGEIIYRAFEDNIYNCWGNDPSSEILIASTAQLAINRIADFRLVTRNLGDEKLHKRYSIFVKQYSISKEAYEYWKLLKLNSENLGTLFDPLPSQVTGNFTALTIPNEPVLGYFSVTSETTKRIFVSRRELPQVKLYTQYDDCTADVVYTSQLSNFAGLLIQPAFNISGLLIGYTRSSSFCVDCRNSGGTNIKPDFWQ